MSAPAALFTPGRYLSRDQSYLVRYPQAEVEAAWRVIEGIGAKPREFGFYQLVEKEIIRARLVADGVVDEMRLHFAISSAFTEAHRNDESYRDWQARNRHRWERVSTAPPALTRPEWEFLAEHFDGANDPTALAILAKARAALAEPA